MIAISTNRYEIYPEPITFDFLNLVYTSTAKYEGDWHSTLHAHQCTELFYVTASQGLFRVENAIFHVQRDYLIIVNSNVEHTELPFKHHPTEYIVLGVHGGEFLLTNSGNNRYCIIDCSKNAHVIRGLMEQIIKEAKEKASYYTIAGNSLLQLLAIQLLREGKFTLIPQHTNKPSIQCAAVKYYIDEHFKEDITLNKLAEIAFLNKHYLVHIFTQEYNISPMRYLMHRRIEESRYLLAQTNYSISEISSMLGFSSNSYFSQTFNRIIGISPSKFRSLNMES